MAIEAIAGNASFDPLRKKIVISLEKKAAPERDDLAELGAAGLLTHLSQHIKYIPANPNTRSPDLHTFWDNNALVEVEVTRADEKIEQKNRRLLSRELGDEILDVGSAYDLTVHLGDLMGDVDRANLLRAAQVFYRLGAGFPCLYRRNLISRSHLVIRK
jgi:hypothetical protein